MHWTVLNRSVELLEARGDCPKVCEMLAKGRAAAYLGAMAHDAPYYYKFGGDAFEEAAAFLHGEEGNDTLFPLKVAFDSAFRASSPESRTQLASFMLGMFSHAVTDWNFHPLVFYFTGDYNHSDAKERKEARRRHRLFETYLDSWLRQRVSFWNSYHLSASIDELGEYRGEICSLLDSVLVPEIFSYYHEEPPEGIPEVSKLRVRSVSGRWGGSLSYLVVLQSIFLSPLTGVVAHVVTKGVSRLAQYEVLFSYGRGTGLDCFDELLTYDNPITGKSETVLVEDLLQRSVEEYTDILSRFEPILSGEKSSSFDVLADCKGKSLNFGIVGAISRDARYYSSRGFALPGLEIL